ncbi:hypothetical protein [Paraburkholderia sp. BL18I3N2]|uniref:hypothetical protein n=1 Tax=Paraburkholderia sp. BL18I3N2 TaxID=1938799 RepID=UPI0011B1EAFD|nr:hypothetical protein [Paraburkholderia sp. BL18I3N2]
MDDLPLPTPGPHDILMGMRSAEVGDWDELLPHWGSDNHIAGFPPTSALETVDSESGFELMTAYCKRRRWHQPVVLSFARSSSCSGRYARVRQTSAKADQATFTILN